MPSFELKLGDAAVVLKDMLAASIDLTVTSPPYDNLRVYKGYSFNFECIAEELYRVTKVGGVAVWIVGDSTVNGSESGTSFKQALFFKEIGFNLHDTMIYAKKAPVPLTHNRYEQQFDYMFVFSKGKPKTFNGLTEPCKDAGKRNHLTHRKTGDLVEIGTFYGRQVKENRLRYNIWFYNNCLTTATRFGHPAPFPLELARDHIESWSNPDDVVLDPFVGSGTTGIAALTLGRNFFGIEISEEYLSIAKERLEKGSYELPDGDASTL